MRVEALRVRVEDGSPLTYPRWVPTTVEADRIVRHHLDDDSWQGCLDAVCGLSMISSTCAGRHGARTCSCRCMAFPGS